MDALLYLSALTVDITPMLLFVSTLPISQLVSLIYDILDSIHHYNKLDSIYTLDSIDALLFSLQRWS
jgi:hypothetical protein